MFIKVQANPISYVGVQAFLVVAGSESWKYLGKARIIFIPAFSSFDPGLKPGYSRFEIRLDFSLSQSLDKLGYSRKSRKFPVFLIKLEFIFAWVYGL